MSLLQNLFRTVVSVMPPKSHSLKNAEINNSETTVGSNVDVQALCYISKEQNIGFKNDEVIGEENEEASDSGSESVNSDEKTEEQKEYSGIGQITNMVVGMTDGVVDNIYRFNQSQFASKGLFPHDKVKFRAVEAVDSSFWRILEIERHKESRILEIEERQKFFITQRKVRKVTQVLIELEALSTITADSMDIIKNTIPEIKTIPGDWLEIKTEERRKVYTNGMYGVGTITVDLFERQEVKGKVTHIFNTKYSTDEVRTFAVIDNFCLVPHFVSLESESLSLGMYVRGVSFKSHQNIIDSSGNELEFNYRVISVVRDEEKEIDQSIERLKFLCMDKRGISIEPKLSMKFGVLYVGSKKDSIFIISNSSHYTHQLLSVKIQGDSVTQFSVSVKREAEDIIAILQPNDRCNVEVKITCEGKYIGETKDYCIFDFGEFKICKEIHVKVYPAQKELVEDLVACRVGFRAYQRCRVQEKKDVERKHAPFTIPGREIVSAGVELFRPAFFKLKVERTLSYRIPEYIKVADKQDNRNVLFENCPLLKATQEELQKEVVRKLTSENYKDMFHVALWFEELLHTQRRQKYNVENCVFFKSGETFYIEFPGLEDVYPKFFISDPLQFCDPNEPEGKIYHANITRLGVSQIFFHLKAEVFKDYDGRPMTVEFLLGRTSYKRCHYAVDKIMENFGPQWLFPESFICLEPRILFVEDENHDHEVKESLVLLYTKKLTPRRRKYDEDGLNGKRKPSVFLPQLEKIGSELSHPEHPVDMTLKWANKSLNQEQKLAIRMILRGQARPSPYIIFGPPGTGKTVTVVEAVIQIHRLSTSSRILVCGPSNAAANQLALYLIEIGKYQPGEFVRLLGFNRSECGVPELLLPYCLDGNQIEHAYVKRIIVTTCNSAGQFLEKYGVVEGWLTHVFIDEAGYCYEPDSVIPCLLTSKNKDPPQIILAGDPNQLGPVLFSDTAAYYGLRVSFLERLMENPLYRRGDNDKYEPLLLTKLVRNYRAHRDLLTVPSRLFYDNELIHASEDNLEELCERLSFLPKKGVPLLFHGMRGEQSRDPDSPSWYNPYEVLQVIDYVRLLLLNHCISEDIGIISPYRKQVDKIKEGLRKEVRCRPIRVGSVEEFQGGEKKIIILSLVRSMDVDESGETLLRLSFAFHPKRFNVCVTRAKSLLIVIGNPHVFVKETVWKELLKYSLLKGVYVGSDLPVVLKNYAEKCKRGGVHGEIGYESCSDEENSGSAPIRTEQEISDESSGGEDDF